MCSVSWTTTHVSEAQSHKHWFEVFTLSFSLVLMLFLEFTNPLLYSEILFRIVLGLEKEKDHFTVQNPLIVATHLKLKVRLRVK